MTTDRFDAGLAVRREVLGDAYVDASLSRATEFNSELQRLVTEYCWGEIWTRPGLPKRTRSLLNIATLVALNRPHELELHIAGALRNGCTTDEIKEVLLQSTIYVGVPAGIDAFRVAARALAAADGHVAPA
ncbi:carboxymuconolactone decarboxylase family protein [Phytohabitans suffuscus]|uniref:4-carboxymuconolactone decarboxylase n=1 Tax=Phytohabitans suffuscus TaxID=624315 RepID=A0A6F8YV65_9ACTN|nr:carboxymuconolactone decarboxylase family protein [Phytohabitans suffuscus]BCB90012.1 4-carboxymuconolactone decarboxylase [Phytohabitans suffuscus]